MITADGIKPTPSTATYWEERGKYFGYPQCCIDQFCASLERTDEQRDASQGTGFVPCTKHSKMILTGHIRIKDLITGRQHNQPFPMDGY